MVLNRKIISTKDGSKTLRIEELKESYHSVHGAVNEAVYVFIENGLDEVASTKHKIRILEMGLGTGLNALITTLFSKKNNLKIEYLGVEKYPINSEEFELLHYADSVSKALEVEQKEVEAINRKMFEAEWEKWNEITPSFSICKVNKDFFDLNTIGESAFDLVYFDAFGAHAQPELWEKDLLQLVVEKMADDGWFTTYAAKGSLKRHLTNLGLKVEKRPGPPGKREMMIAYNEK